MKTYSIIILGSGESGTGAALLAQQQGLSVFVSDKGMIADTYKQELLAAGIPFEEGSHNEAMILSASEIIKSPGIPTTVPLIQKLRAQGTPIISEIEFAYRYKGQSKIVAITGSNGKTTTTSLIFDMFQKDGKHVSLVGNIGYSFARQIAVAPTEWYVMEISSFQLDDIHTFQPDIAVITNITPDHLDRYEYNFDLYAAAKFKIAQNQTSQDYLILCSDDEGTMQRIKQLSTPPIKLYFSMTEQIQTDGAYVSANELVFRLNGEPYSLSINELSLKGKHNQYNSLAAGISARCAEVRNESIRECLKTFSSIEHRLESVASIRGVEFINDSKATNINSVWYALESMKKPTILILGGIDKGNDYNLIMPLVESNVKAIICIGKDNSKLLEVFRNKVPVVDTNNMKDAVQSAYELSVPGDAVLLSPACASFDLFEDFEDRGEQFKQYVLAL